MLTTDHLILDCADRKIKVKSGLQITFERGSTVVFRNHMATVAMRRDGQHIYAAINGEVFLVERYHVSYNAYPVVRTALT